MKTENSVTIDGNEAAARVPYRLNEVTAIYPITPASPIVQFWRRMQSTQGWPERRKC